MTARGGPVFTGGLTAAASEDPGSQARDVYGRLADLLDREAASGVCIVEYVADRAAGRYGDIAAVRRAILGETAAVQTVVVNGIVPDGPLLTVEALADGAASASGVVYLPSLLPLDDSGALVGDGDLVAQTHAVYDRATSLLSALGLSAESIVRTIDFVTPAAVPDYKRTGRVRKERLGPVYPAAAGIIMRRLLHAGALIQVDVTATRHDPQPVNPGWERYAKLTYSPAVRAGRVLFGSGQAALDPATERAVHAGDVGAQAAYTYANIGRVLEAAGATPGDLTRLVEYVTPAGTRRYADAARARERFLGGTRVAVTTVVCEALLRPEFEIEIDPTAVLP